MALSRVKNWIAGEVLTASDLNTEFSNILNNPSSLITPVGFNLTFTDATYDIGASGATRPRDLFLSRNAVIGGTLGVSGLITKTNTAATSSQFLSVVGSTTASTYGSISNTTGGLTCGMHGVAADLLSGAAAYASVLYTSTNTTLCLGSNNTLAITIAGGLVMTTKAATAIGTVGTEFQTNGAIWATADGAASLFLNRLTSDGTIANFETSSVVRGSISIAGATTSYNTSSGAELKNVHGPITDAGIARSLRIMRETQMYEYDWKDQPTADKPTIGPVAEELAKVYRGAVSAAYDDGEQHYPAQVDKTAWAWHNVIAWQYHDREIEALRELIAALNAKIAKLEKKPTE